MSSGQTPRTPRYFPNMKVRGARRKRMAWAHHLQRNYDTLGAAFVKLARQVCKIGPAKHVEVKWGNSGSNS